MTILGPFMILWSNSLVVVPCVTIIRFLILRCVPFLYPPKVPNLLLSKTLVLSRDMLTHVNTPRFDSGVYSICLLRE